MMQRTRAWRRSQFLKRRSRDRRLINSVVQPYGEETLEENYAQNDDAIRKGGYQRSGMCRNWRDGPWFDWLQKDKKKKKDRPLDKEWKAWYD